MVEQGNHNVHFTDGTRPQIHVMDGVTIAHLPVRTVEQLSAKVVNGWQAYLVKNRHAEVPTAGFQWQLLYERVVHGRGIDDGTLIDVALNYAQPAREGRTRAVDAMHDPVAARYGALRYLHLARTNLLAKIAMNIESYILNGDGTWKPDTDETAAPRRDIAGLLEVLRQSDAVRLHGAAGSDGARWVEELVLANPGWQRTEAGAADLLLAADMPAARFATLARDAASHPARRVVWWTPHAAAPAELDATLATWYDAGWEPHMLETLGYRALSAFPELRAGAFVLQPRDAARETRAVAVRAALCGMGDGARPAARPIPKRVLHPMQDMDLLAA